MAACRVVGQWGKLADTRRKATFCGGGQEKRPRGTARLWGMGCYR